jgi:hypothetical protein
VDEEEHAAGGETLGDVLVGDGHAVDGAVGEADEGAVREADPGER